MSEHYQVVIASLAEYCLKEIESCMSGTVGAWQAAVFVDNLLMDSVEKISQEPERFRYNAYLSERGLLLRERLDVEGEYRVIYDFQGDTVQILLFVSMKQDFGSLLYRYNILK